MVRNYYGQLAPSGCFVSGRLCIFCGSLVSVAVVIKRRGVFCTETDIVLCKYRPIVHCNLNKDDVKLSNSCVLFYY